MFVRLPKFLFRSRVAPAFPACLLLFALAATQAKVDFPDSSPGEKQTRFAPIQLRGYGKVSGEFMAFSGTSSLLTIHCESEAKAKIAQAKYLSDLGLLPGVESQSVPTARGALAARRVEGQGIIAALRSGSDVFVLAAPDATGLATLSDKQLPRGVAAASSAITEKDAGVPMYLDRWDRYGMRFYYTVLALPQDINAAPGPTPYSPATDFDFALNSGNCGLVLWQNAFPIEQAEGILKTPMWDWVVTQAEKIGTPLGINISMAVPCSLFNRYRDEWQRAEPEYLGGYYGLRNTDEGFFSSNSVAGRDAELAELQLTVRQYNKTDNVVNWLNPDAEMSHGPPDNLIEYGPFADAGYRKFLKEKYGTVQVVAKRWGDGTARSWSDVHVPELASFEGWGPEAIDLTGTWKVSHDAPAGAEASDYDDAKWPSMTAPGDAIGILLPQKPALLRRHFAVDPKWRQQHGQAWLYVFDLNDTRENSDVFQSVDTQTYLNGTRLDEAAPAEPHTEAHWAAYDVSSMLKAGDNTVAVRLPQGFFNYRIYISAQAPRSYPDLGPQMNARWADFIDWGSWIRANAVKRGSEMIRQVDPNRPLTFMAPDAYADDLKTVCEDYGGVFHNTGYMAGVWSDFNSMQMESANLPTDEEPGSGAKSLDEFKGFLGRWSTEGIQGVDYFQHIGDVEWKPDLKNYFENTLNLWHLMGKYHVPKAQLALLASDRIDRLYGFPFHRNPQDVLPHGQWELRFNELLLPEYAREEVFPHDFERGYADAYKVIIDSNTSIMDDDFVTNISKWVKAGGIFITWGQTGRHTSVEKDAWPISKLTGYKVLSIDKQSRKVHLAGEQPFLKSDPAWDSVNARGLTLQKNADGCTDLLDWDDGSAAVGLRHLGKGYVITVGPQLDFKVALKLFEGVLEWAKIERIPAAAPGVIMRHFVSNNGLYDVWAIWNDKHSPVKTTLTLRNGLPLKTAWDVKTGKEIALTESAEGLTLPLNLDTFETEVFLTPRLALSTAPEEWFGLQRNWWRGSGELGAPMPEFKSKYTLDLQSGWGFKPLAGDASQGATLADPSFNDTSWEKQPLGIFNFTPHSGDLHAMYRKKFTVPAGWAKGPVTLWLSEWHGVGYLDHGQAYLDGKPVSTNAILGDDLGGVLRPGTSHTLAVEIWGSNPVVGTPASVWLNYRPDTSQSLDLAGSWTPAEDGLSYAAPVTMPGTYHGVTLRRTVKIDSRHAAQTAVLRLSAEDNSIYGVIVNGTWISRFHHHIGNKFDITVTPYLKAGQDNELVLFGREGAHTLTSAALEFYEKGTYP